MKAFLVAIVILLAPALSVPAPSYAEETQERVEKRVKLYVEKWDWSPNLIRVKRGTHVVLDIESRDASRVFFLPAYKVKVRIPQGESVTTEFDADRVGEFPWRCKLPCGDRCSKLRGTLIVEE